MIQLPFNGGWTMETVEIDGSFGEGGGQILRTALALSAILRRPLAIHHIRSKRRNPGLGHQHLAAVNALAKICGARVQGNEVGSEELIFIPGEVAPGDYRFAIGTAGSITLLVQALLLPLSLSSRPSRLVLEGGTHVPWSPTYDYMAEVLFPTLASMGISAKARTRQWGWYPKGGGTVEIEIEPSPVLNPIDLTERGSLKRIRGLSASSHLPTHVAERQRAEALRRIRTELKIDAEIMVSSNVPAQGPGSFIFLIAESERAIAGFSSLGRKGRPAEEVAREAFESLRDYLAARGSVDPYLADQLIPFMALAKGGSSFTTTRVTEHLLTNVWVVRQFMNVDISVKGEKGEEGRVDLS